MPYITKIQLVSSGIYKVTINDVRLFLEPHIFIKYNLQVGEEISAEQLDLISSEAKRLQIKQRAIFLLYMRHHSKFELTRKLKTKFKEHDVIVEVVNNLSEQGLLNDDQFAEHYTESLVRKRSGINKIKAKLFEKGINREISNENADRTKGDLLEEYQAGLKKEFEKKFLQLQNKKFEQKDIIIRVTRYLLSKGYTYQEIKTCIYENLDNLTNETEGLLEDE